MTPRSHPHCLYFAVSKTLEQNAGLPLDQALVFHCLGGLTFELEQLPNDKVPSYYLRGNVLKYEECFKQTGIRISRFPEVREDKALEDTMRRLETDGYQLVMTNCFFLPYDETNYKKNTDNHLVLIHSYDAEQDAFCVSDSCYDRVTIDRAALMTARLKTLPGFNKYQSLRIDLRRRFDGEAIRNNLRRAVLERAETYRENQALDAFRQVLRDIDACEGIFRKLACTGISRSLRHPSSLPVTRHLMADSCEQLFPETPELAAAYRELAEAWVSFSNNIVRFGHETIDLAGISEMYQAIADQERACNDQLLRQSVPM